VEGDLIMTTSDTVSPPRPGPEHKRLDAFVGTWKTEGEIRASPSGSAVMIHATDTYEWLPGRFFLIHRWDAHMPDGNTKGIEIIGYDASSKTYPMHSFDSEGNFGIMRASVKGDIWSFAGESLRFKGGFRDGGNTFAGIWEQRSRDGLKWVPWMDIRLRKGT
jgi:Protein of unknown function (DUF1579)